MADVPHLSLPLTIVGEESGVGAYDVVEQDTVDELVTTVRAVVSFPIGYRIEAPEFGITDPELSRRPLNVTDIEGACEAYEPRADVRVYEGPYDPLDPLATTVRIEVTMPGGEDA